jgi:hypothetical protein
VTYRLSQFQASTMTLFLLLIWCVGREFIDAVDFTRQLSLSFQWRFQGLQGLRFHWRFMDKPWHSVLDNSMHKLWLYFCNWFDASVVNSLTLSIPYVSCHSIFSDNFKVYITQFSLTIYGSIVIYRFTQFHASAMTLFLLSIWCVGREFIDAVDFKRQLSLSS